MMCLNMEFYESVRVALELFMIPLIFSFIDNFFDKKCSDYRVHKTLVSTTTSCLNLKHKPIGVKGASLIEDFLQCKEYDNLSSKPMNEIKLTWNCLDLPGAKIIIDCLCHKKRKGVFLQRLDLHGNFLGHSSAKLFRNAINQISSLKVLNLKDNVIADRGAKHLGEALEQNFNLISLDLERNEITQIGAEYVSNALKSNSTLRYLNLTSNFVQDEGVKALCAVLMEKNSTLQVLKLHNNSIGFQGATYIAEMLCFNTTLKELHIGCNKSMTQEGIQIIAEAIMSCNKTLTVLNLDGNTINRQSARVIGELIGRNSSGITHLNLRSCFISDEGSIYIGKSLATNTKLRILNLQGNLISVGGAEAIGDALCHNTSLEMLNLAFNHVCGNIDALGKGLYANCTLKVLSLAYTFGRKDLYHVNSVLRKALFFPLSTAHSKDNDNDTIYGSKMHDVHDNQVGWSTEIEECPSIIVIDGIPQGRDNRCSSLYGWKAFASIKDKYGSYPLHKAMKAGLKWDGGMQSLLKANYLAMKVPEPKTSLLPFMIAAVDKNSDLESVYQLIKQDPVGLISHIQ